MVVVGGDITAPRAPSATPAPAEGAAPDATAGWVPLSAAERDAALGGVGAPHPLPPLGPMGFLIVGNVTLGDPDGLRDPVRLLRGSMRTLPPGRRQVNMIETRKREHSRKPDEQHSIIEACSPGPYLEMFARYPRQGWTSSGFEADEDTQPRGKQYPAYR